MSFNNLDEIRIFNQVVSSSGFTAAAIALKLPTNIVSRKIASLEKRLGTRLLNRTTRKISLTTEGKLLFERSSELLQEFDNLEVELTKTKLDVSGIIRVAVRTTTIEFGLLDFLSELLIEYKELEIHLVVSDSSPDIVGSAIDVALMIGDLPDSSLIAKKIGEVVFCLCAAPKYIANSGEVKRIEDLENHEYILPWQKRSGYKLKLQGRDGSIISLKPNSRFQSNDVRTRAEAVYAGLGIGAVPLTEVIKQSKEGKLVRILPEFILPPIPVWSVKSKKKKNDQKIQLIENILQLVVLEMGSLELAFTSNQNT